MIKPFRSIRQLEVKAIMIKGIVLDMDGVMFDTERLAIKAWSFAGAQAGLSITEELVMKTIGLNTENTKRVLFERLGSDFDFEAVRKIRVDYALDYIERNGMPMKYGLFELLDYLKTNCYKITVATSTESAKVKYYFSKSGLSEYFNEIVCGDMIIKGKPEPDIYLKACEMLGLTPPECLALEDSPNGILSAYRAGMKPVMIPDLIEPDDELRRTIYAEVPTLSHVIPLLEMRTHSHD
jgi:HAD superfamily hydrolase (TIGR01509 family)